MLMLNLGLISSASLAPRVRTFTRISLRLMWRAALVCLHGVVFMALCLVTTAMAVLYATMWLACTLVL